MHIAVEYSMGTSWAKYYFPYAVAEDEQFFWSNSSSTHLKTDLRNDPYAVDDKLHRLGERLKSLRIPVESIEVGGGYNDLLAVKFSSVSDGSKEKFEKILGQVFCLDLKNYETA